MELLSPAGSYESMVAAVQNGADAVYMGGTMFNARRNAKNFDDSELERAIDYCHIRSARAYVTMNTLLFDREMASALRYAEFLYRIGADALIVQDAGLISELNVRIPDLELHASTQMGIHTEGGLRACRRLGLRRAVISREVSLEGLRRLSRAKTGVEIEAFAHGALCMSFSGGCLYSSMAGERSGNRGMCAQPCRKPASAAGYPQESDCCLSPADLCMLLQVGDLIEAGVGCIKLEGRMKRPEYVASVTRAYRAAIDKTPKEELIGLLKDVERIFSRGHTTGYYYGDGVITGAKNTAEPENALLNRVKSTYSGERNRTGVSMRLSMRIGRPAELLVAAGAEASAHVIGKPVQTAIAPREREAYIRQLDRLGGTPFYAESIAVDMDDGAFLPASEINAMRREACELLKKPLCFKREAPAMSIPEYDGVNMYDLPPKLIARAINEDQAEAADKAGADEVIIDPVRYGIQIIEKLQFIREKGKRLLLALPAVTLNGNDYKGIMELVDPEKLDGIEINNAGQLDMAKKAGFCMAGAGMNLFNTSSLRLMERLGVNRSTLSQELSRPQLRDILKKLPAAVCIYGRTVLMQLAHCPVKEHKGCLGCRGMAGTITDGDGRRFPMINTVLGGGCIVRMLNCNPTYIIDRATELRGVSAWVLSFYDESPELVSRIISDAVRARNGETGDIEAPRGTTRGHWQRNVL